MPENEANQPMVNLCGGKGKTVGVNGKTMCRLTNFEMADPRGFEPLTP